MNEKYAPPFAKGDLFMPMDWNKYHCYRVFDEFIENFILGKKSYITRHQHPLNLEDGLAEIKRRFVDNYDESGED